MVVSPGAVVTCTEGPGWAVPPLDAHSGFVVGDRLLVHRADGAVGQAAQCDLAAVGEGGFGGALGAEGQAAVAAGQGRAGGVPAGRW